MKDRDTPLRIVRMWPKMMPGCYEVLDTCRDAKAGGEISWPDCCILPINAAATYLCASSLSPVEAAAVAAELTACYLWRQSKIIYSYDAALAATLAEQVDDTEDTDILPSDLLLHLPHACVYIKAPELIEHLDGFFAWADYDVNRHGAELRISWLADDMQHTFSQVLHLVPGGTIAECVDDTAKTTGEYCELSDREAPAVEVARMMLTAIQLLLYITASNADIDEQPRQGVAHPVGARHKKTVDITDKASEVRAFDVGIRVGAAIRKAADAPTAHTATAGSGASKRPDLRRGHWHHYWQGRKDEERRLILKWTAPTVIHPDQGGTDDVVIFPVK